MRKLTYTEIYEDSLGIVEYDSLGDAVKGVWSRTKKPVAILERPSDSIDISEWRIYEISDLSDLSRDSKPP